MSDKHICKCQECRNVIARVVEEVLGGMSDQEDLSDTVEYTSEEDATWATHDHSQFQASQQIKKQSD